MDVSSNNFKETVHREEAEIRYSFVWEDFLLLKKALPSKKGTDRLLIIGSSGENALSLLDEAPQEIVVIDLNPAQMALLELKMAALKELEFQQFIELFGFAPSEQRQELFKQVSCHLSSKAESFWQKHREILLQGITEAGRLEKYFRKFRTEVLEPLIGSHRLSQLAECTSMTEQLNIWSQIDLKQLKQKSETFFSQDSLSKQGRHSSQFKYVKEQNVGLTQFQRFTELLNRELISKNSYLYFFFFGKHLIPSPTLPLLCPAGYQKLRSQVEKITLVQQDLGTYLESSEQNFDFMVFSDIFEYLSDQESVELYQRSADRLSMGGRLVHWSLFVDRICDLPEMEHLQDLSQKLTAIDATWFYSKFSAYEKLDR